MEWYDACITKSNGVYDGAPILNPTRTPVRTVVENRRVYDSDLRKSRAPLPHLLDTQIEAALADFEHHREEFDSDVERLRTVLTDILKAS